MARSNASQLGSGPINGDAAGGDAVNAEAASAESKVQRSELLTDCKLQTRTRYIYCIGRNRRERALSADPFTVMQRLHLRHNLAPTQQRPVVSKEMSSAHSAPGRFGVSPANPWHGGHLASSGTIERV